MVFHGAVQPEAPTDFRSQFILKLAAGDFPRGMQLAAVGYLAFSAGSMLIIGTRPEILVGDLTISILTFVIGTMLQAGWLPMGWSRWLMPLSLAAMGSLLAWQAQFDDSRSSLIYAALILVIHGSVTLHRLPLFVSGAMLLSAYLWANPRIDGAWDEWAFVGITAWGIGIAGHMIRMRGVHRLADAMWSLELTATVDPLTGALNRHGLQQRWTQVRASAMRRGEPIFALLVDIDRMKSINDQHGHLVGDRAIQHTAAALASIVRGDDVVARFGGDEMVVIGVGHAPQPSSIRDRLQVMLHQSGDADLMVAVTVGHVELTPEPELTLDDLVDQADQVMYATRARLRVDGG